MQNSWALVGARSQLRSKVKFFNFVPISRFIDFVHQRQNAEKPWQVVILTIPLTKQIEKKVWDLLV